MSDRTANLILTFASLFICLIIGEVTLRLVLADELYIVESERSLTYQFDEELGWFPIPDSEVQFDLTTSISLKHNSRGFRDIEHEPSSKAGILFLGDSFTWGYDVEAEQRFTDLLRDSLLDYELFNLGVSGYGTDQEFLLLQKHIAFYDPEIVIITFCADNDRLDNSMNLRYVNYYKPYFTFEENELKLQGQPVPASAVHWFTEHPFWSNLYTVRLGVNAYFKNNSPGKLLNEDPTHQIFEAIHDYLDQRDVQLLVTLQKPDEPLTTFLDSREIPFIDVSNDMVFPFSGNHWTPEGHRFVASKLKAFIEEESAD